MFAHIYRDEKATKRQVNSLTTQMEKRGWTKMIKGYNRQNDNVPKRKPELRAVLLSSPQVDIVEPENG